MSFPMIVLIVVFVLLIFSLSAVIVIVLMDMAFMILLRVPYVKTEKKYFPIIFNELQINNRKVIYDLGSGNGDFLLAAAGRGAKKCIGFELSPVPYLLSVCKTLFYRGKTAIRIFNRSFYKADLSDADIVYVYLVQTALKRLAEKLEQELKPGAVVICKGSSFPDWKPYKKILINPKIGDTLFFYRR